jgi:hypothetical protein
VTAAAAATDAPANMALSAALARCIIDCESQFATDSWSLLAKVTDVTCSGQNDRDVGRPMHAGRDPCIRRSPH